jgi:hypothetical protein
MTFTLEDYLVSLHTGQWFGWSDSKNKIYANLVILSDDAKPSESDCTAGVAAMQAAYDAKAYARNRVAEYPSIGDQLDMIYHNGNGGATFQAAIKAVKDKYPKE